MVLLLSGSVVYKVHHDVISGDIEKTLQFLYKCPLLVTDFGSVEFFESVDALS